MTPIYFDGGCKPNPGMMEVAIVICHEGRNEMLHERLSHGTNNEAEWLSFIWGMMKAHELGLTEVSFHGDSKLVICQAKGEWKCNKPELQSYLAEYKRLRPLFTRVGLVHVPRAKNLAGHHIEAVN
jgi:ribonuclease HI